MEAEKEAGEVNGAEEEVREAEEVKDGGKKGGVPSRPGPRYRRRRC